MDRVFGLFHLYQRGVRVWVLGFLCCGNMFLVNI